MKDFLTSVKKAMRAEHTELSLSRLRVCAACSLKEKTFLAELISSKMVETQGYSCSKCSCPIATKIFASDKKNICDKWLK